MIKRASRDLSDPHERSAAVDRIGLSVYRALAAAELKAPASAQGAFIPVGHPFEAMMAVGKVLETATKDVLIVDPYMDDKALSDFAILVPEGTLVRLLADQQHLKPSLRPAAQRWVAQYGPTRPLDARLTALRALHDRLILVDDCNAWVLTQSLNNFAGRAPASIVRADKETASLKIDAYRDIWKTATPL